MKVKALFFYADRGMVNSANPGWLYAYFNTLAGLFDRMVLKNVKKNVGIV